jgi:hypothetical protein
MTPTRTPWSDLSHEELIEKLENNHMWINAFSAISPTDELKIAIGEWVLDELKYSKIGDSLGLSPTAILRVNKS